ncbi:BMP family ABC transporter substrate-binding protein [Xylanimonas ulmi]|uniref:BMP family ABC transporter substrate-binding protein n=1 Tax=Xylanimonas ulmi TaxID=228973 RepID=A0A4Q7M570_9MICO|nr:BMP family ABC transporter substrate-binding protein [Xylanibacterium ulmi]RZS61159.1 hypothetical protein EV386_1447 [Xylanibacterium ulmi]
MRRRARATAVVATAVTAVLALTGCDGTTPTGAPSPSASSTGAPLTGFAAAFLGATTTPAPEATVTPTPGTWDDVTPPAGYTMALITAGDDPASATLSDAVRGFAVEHGVALTVLPTADDDQVEAAVNRAVGAHPDLVVGAGDGVVDVFALLTAQHLDTQFLLVGSQLPEPTDNVTAVVWEGAGFRGSGLGSGHANPAAVTRAQSLEATRVGVTAVLYDLTGIVLDLR